MLNNPTVTIDRYGGPEVLTYREVKEDLRPGVGEALIRVLATSACYTDTLIRRGFYPEVREKPPLVPGYDLVGIVESLGPGKTSRNAIQVGDVVCDLTVTGSYRRYTLRPAEGLVVVPKDADPAAASALPLTYMTAYQMLEQARLRSGDHLLVVGASGTVGQALMELAAIRGIRVLGTGAPSKRSLVENRGAEFVDYTRQDYRDRCREWAPGGAHAVIDALGLDAFRKSFRCVAPGGVLIAYGMQALADGTDPRMIRAIGPFLNILAWNVLPNRRRSLFYVITAERKKNPDAYRRHLEALLVLLRDGSIRPRDHITMPLSKAREAHEMIDARSRLGRIVLTP